MTPTELIRNYKEHNPRGHFFDRATLRFFGERVKDMRVFEVKLADEHGNLRPVYKLRTLQLNAPFKPAISYHYFDRATFEEVVKHEGMLEV